MDINTYLNSKNPAYFLDDNMKDDTRIVFFDTFPKRRDISRGYPTTADETTGGSKILGEATALLTALSPATVYISNHILVPTDKDTEPLLGPLEGLRLGPAEHCEPLRSRFADKMRRIIENDSITLVVYKGDMFRRYYNDYLRNEKRPILERLSERLDAGLKIIPMPSHTASQIQRMKNEYDTFVESLLLLTDD